MMKKIIGLLGLVSAVNCQDFATGFYRENFFRQSNNPFGRLDLQTVSESDRPSNQGNFFNQRPIRHADNTQTGFLNNQQFSNEIEEIFSKPKTKFHLKQQAFAVPPPPAPLQHQSSFRQIQPFQPNEPSKLIETQRTPWNLIDPTTGRNINEPVPSQGSFANQFSLKDSNSGQAQDSPFNFGDQLDLEQIRLPRDGPKPTDNQLDSGSAGVSAHPSSTHYLDSNGSPVYRHHRRNPYSG